MTDSPAVLPLAPDAPEPSVPSPIHVMVDLETFGRRPGAVIRSLGAVKFTKEGILDRFHVGVELASALSAGLRIDAETLTWWQHPDRRDALDALNALEAVDIGSALMGFSEWCGTAPFAIWGNSAKFDLGILEAAYTACDFFPPWHPRDERCYRTINTLFGESVPYEPVAQPHVAVTDAEWQAKRLIRVLDGSPVQW